MKTLKRQRQLLGLTQHELAHSAKISPWKITFGETGRVRLTSEEIQRVKTALARRAEQVSAALAAA
jgi:predicted transcriptional regulator